MAASELESGMAQASADQNSLAGASDETEMMDQSTEPTEQRAEELTIDDSGRTTNGDTTEAVQAKAPEMPEYVAFKSALKEASESPALTPNVAPILAGLGDLASDLMSQIMVLSNEVDNLNSTVTRVNSVSNTRIARLHNNLNNLCAACNVPGFETAPRQKVEDQKKNATEEMKPRHARNKMTTKRQMVAEEINAKNSGIHVVLDSNGPLSLFSTKTPLRVGDMVFMSTEQALIYITAKHLGQNDIGVKSRYPTHPNPFQPTNVAYQHAKAEIETESWQETMKDVSLALFQLRMQQDKEFEEALQGVDQEADILFSTAMNTGGAKSPFGIGIELQQLADEPSCEITGKNLYGKWLKEFRQIIALNASGFEPFEVGKYCVSSLVSLPKEKNKVVLLGDASLANLTGFANTTVLVKEKITVGTADTPESAKTILESMEELENLAAVILVVTSPESGRSPENLEKDYSDFFSFCHEKWPGMAVVITNALPVPGGTIKFANYVINCAALKAKQAGMNVALIDVASKMEPKMVNRLMFEKGFLNKTGTAMLIEVLTEEVPFAFVSVSQGPSKKARARERVRMQEKVYEETGPAKALKS